MMKRVMEIVIVMVVAIVPLVVRGQTSDQKPAPTLKSVLLQQLKDTHINSNWFVCANVALAGVTPEQANWTDGKGNHSVGQLAYHIWFWNDRNLRRLKGKDAAKFSGNNDETFDRFDAKSWSETVQKLDAVLTELEKMVDNADETKLKAIAPTIANINTHNAYHIGEIVMVRKEQGSWDPSKGVK